MRPFAIAPFLMNHSKSFSPKEFSQLMEGRNIRDSRKFPQSKHHFQAFRKPFDCQLVLGAISEKKKSNLVYFMDFIIALFIFHPRQLKPVLNNASSVALKRQYRLGLCALLSENQAWGGGGGSCKSQFPVPLCAEGLWPVVGTRKSYPGSQDTWHY